MGLGKEEKALMKEILEAIEGFDAAVDAYKEELTKASKKDKKADGEKAEPAEKGKADDTEESKKALTEAYDAVNALVSGASMSVKSVIGKEWNKAGSLLVFEDVLSNKIVKLLTLDFVFGFTTKAQGAVVKLTQGSALEVAKTLMETLECRPVAIKSFGAVAAGAGYAEEVEEEIATSKSASKSKASANAAAESKEDVIEEKVEAEANAAAESKEDVIEEKVEAEANAAEVPSANAEQAQAQAPVATPAIVSDKKVCKSCGNVIDKRAFYCPICHQMADVAPAGGNASSAQNNQQAAQTNTFSIVALILSFFVPLAGFILGIMGVKKSAQTGSGKGMAVAAITISLIGIIFGIIVTIISLPDILFILSM